VFKIFRAGIGLLNDYLSVSDPNEHFVADIHSGDGKLVLVEVHVDVVVLPSSSLAPLGLSFFYGPSRLYWSNFASP